MQLVNIGFGNLINADKIVSIISNDSAPAKRIIQESRHLGLLVDATQGRKTKSLLIMDSNHVILSYLNPISLGERMTDDELAYPEDSDE